MKKVNPNIIYVDWKNKEHVSAVSNLHLNLLPDSILTKLGFDFLVNFYYSKLCKEKLIDVYLYKYKGEFIGFISCTNKPFTFIDEGSRKYFFLICVLLLKVFLTKPARMFSFLKHKKDDSINNLKEIESKEIGQFLSFGVLERFRKIIDEFDNQTIPNVLMNKVFEHFQKNNKKTFFLQVLKSNFIAIQFYKKYNGKIITVENSESNIVMFDLK